MGDAFEEKVARLETLVRGLPGAVVALSGGVDSAVLLAVAAQELPGRVLAATGLSAVVSRREREDASRVAQYLGVPHVFFESREMLDERFRRNDRDRCYYCKKTLFEHLWELARSHGYGAVLEGANASDLSDFRPGRRAAREAGVRAPLMEAGLTKEDVRRLARRYGLPVSDKPSSACLASRIPYGRRIEPESLARIEEAERWLGDLGFAQVRVRDHGDLARIEVRAEDLGALVARARDVVERLRGLGWSYVTLDLEGYRTGSMNRVLNPQE